MKRTVGVMTVAVMLCAQTGAYAADQMSKERESGKPSGQSGQDMQRQSGQSGQSGQPGQSGQDMKRQSSGEAGPSFSEEMQRQNAQIWQSGKQAQSLCQKPGQGKQAASQQDQAGQSKQPSQAAKDQGQTTPEQSKQLGQAPQDQDKQSGQEQNRAMGATQTIKGQFVRMEGDFYVIKDQSGKETCIPTSYGTFVDQTFSPGDTIAARVGQDGTALLIGRPSDRQTASSDVQGQEMSQATADQRRDKTFSGSPQGAQGQDSGTRDQSKDKAFSGSQQSASTVKGELLKIQGEFYTVKDQSGSEVRLHVNKETKMESAVSVGDKIEAERTSSDHAVSIKKAQDAAGTRNR